MKTTLELPDDLFRLAKSRAAEQGRSLKDFFTEALRDKIARDDACSGEEPAWKNLFGQFGKTEGDRKENQRIQRRIDQEFGEIDPME